MVKLLPFFFWTFFTFLHMLLNDLAEAQRCTSPMLSPWLQACCDPSRFRMPRFCYSWRLLTFPSPSFSQTFLFGFGSIWIRSGQSNDREHFSWHSVVALFSHLGQLMSTSTSGLAGHPVNDDKWQTHDHEDKAQASKARSLWKWKE